jgi:hypothetical protein
MTFSAALDTHANPCAACQQQHSAETPATCEHPRQSLAVAAAMHTAGWQLHSAQRITTLATHMTWTKPVGGGLV